MQRAAFRILQGLIHLTPRPFCLLLGRWLGMIFYFLDRRHRHTSLSNLQQAFGNILSVRERRSIARKSFAHFGRTIVDILKMSLSNPERVERLLSFEGEKNLKEALSKNRGILMFSAHYGNWEVAPLLISRYTRLNVIARPLDNPGFEKELRKIRAFFRAQVIYKQQASRDTLRALGRNEMVAILIDQNVLRREAVFVDFFGLTAATTPGLATFYLRTKAPLIPVFCFPEGHKYIIHIGDPVDVRTTGDVKQDIRAITQQCTQRIEERIRLKPEYWLWFHDRWRSRPESVEKQPELSNCP
jgi:Kdo2-lipid IVA lauroyltransferase/acyltransferase